METQHTQRLWADWHLQGQKTEGVKLKRDTKIEIVKQTPITPNAISELNSESLRVIEILEPEFWGTNVIKLLAKFYLS